ncbi:MAG: outer membrane lipoprotein-sorting protein, partial [Myxococcota bacterium]
TEFWDLKGKPLKTIYAREIRRVDGIWTAHQFEATNHKTGHRTIFTFSNMDYESAVDDDLFTERALRHGP